MIRFYLLQIKMGRMTLGDVPTRWRDAVEVALDAQEVPHE